MKWNFEINGKLVRITANDGALIHGFLTPVKSKKILIYVPGFYSNFYDDFRFPYLVDELTKAGWAFLPVNNRGHDAISDTTTVKGNWFTAGTTFEKFEDCLKDIKAAVDFVSKKGFKEIILMGLSTGCQKITYYQSMTQDKRVNGLILLGAVDDYNSYVKNFGEEFENILRLAQKLKKDELMPLDMISGYILSAGRFLSDADPKNVEANIFNYDLKMEIFSSVKCPVFAVFGSKDQYLTKTIQEHFKILRKYTRSSKFDSLVIKNTEHSFIGKEKELAQKIAEWLKTI